MYTLIVNNGKVSEMGLAILAILHEDKLLEYSANAIASSKAYQLEAIVDRWSIMMSG